MTRDRKQAACTKIHLPARLFVPHTGLGQGGGERVLVQLLETLDRDLFTPSLGLMTAGGQYRDQVPDDVEILEMRAASLWWVVPALVRILRQHRPEIVFSMGAMSVAAALGLLLTRSPARFVISERNMLTRPEAAAKTTLLNVLKRLLYRRADHLIAVSEGVKQDLVDRLGLPAERISVPFNPIVGDDLATLAAEPVDHPWFEGDVPVLLAVGRLVPQKGYPRLIASFARVRAKRPAKLVILGDGPLRRRIESLIESRGLTGDVWMPGFEPNPFKYMSKTSVFALSSVQEGLPGSLIQAMACGAAVVATDCRSGPSEIVQDGFDGRLVPVGDVEAMASSIITLLDRADLRQLWGERARVSMRRFSVGPAVRRYERALLGDASGEPEDQSR